MEHASESAISQALRDDRVIDITTTGRRSGRSRRIEIWFFNLDDTLYLTGAPGAERHWYRNLCADPRFTVHLKQSVAAELPAVAHPLLEDAQREPVLRGILGLFRPEIPAEWMPGRSDAERHQTELLFASIAADPEAVLPSWMDQSPLVRIEPIPSG